MPDKLLGLCVVVPLLNERERLPALIRELEKLDAEQNIIVDGGSTDGSYQWLQKNWQNQHNRLLDSAPGRAKQMNKGAQEASQDMLLFLHADTQLPVAARDEICAAPFATKTYWGRFDLGFDSTHKPMKLIAYFINLRSRISGVATGDQSIFMHRAMFESVGGYDDIALMEDIAMSKKLRRLSWPNSSYLKVITSARRWKSNGVFKTVLKMWWYRLAFFCGVSPEKLANSYRNIR